MLVEDVVDAIVEHHGVKGQKWGVRNSSSTSSGQPRTRLEKQITKADNRLSDTISNPRKVNQLKVELHNQIGPVAQSKWNVISSKPKYYKAAQEGRLNNPNDPVAKQYLNEINGAYMKTMNDHLKGFSNASGTKVVTATLNSNDFLGFTLNLSDRPGVTHADPFTMRVNYIRADDGTITDSILGNDSMSQGSLFIDDILEHHGVKGQKWGVRRGERTSTSGVLSELSGKPEQRRDERWRNKKVRGNTFNLTSKINRQVEKDTHKNMKPDIKALNKRPEFRTSEAKKAIKQASKTFGRPKDSGIAQKYYDEHTKIWKKHLIASADKHMMTSPSGKWETELWVSTSMNGGAWNVGVRRVDEATHAEKSDMDVVMSARPVFDDEGFIIDWELVNSDITQSAIDDILEHHGVKGMKWGVRRKGTVGPTEVIVSDKRKRLKTSGGKGHPAHEDAIKSRTTGQIGRKSGVKSLSNAQLKAYNERLNLEQNYTRLQYQDSGPGQKFVKMLTGKKGQAAGESIGKAAIKSEYVRKKMAIGAAAIALA